MEKTAKIEDPARREPGAVELLMEMSREGNEEIPPSLSSIYGIHIGKGVISVDERAGNPAVRVRGRTVEERR